MKIPFKAERQENGVRIRADGRGDCWANEHRQQLGYWFHMNDMDAFMGHCAFAQNTGDRFFMEYVPDNYQHRNNRIRTFATVALFDRKATYEVAEAAVLCTGYYLDLARRIGRSQPIRPKFFWVIGTQKPWTMIELDIDTASEIGRHILDSGNWRQIWEAAGLIAMRRELRKWIDPVPQ